MALFAYDFWNRVDQLKGNIKLSQVAEETGIKYQTLRNQRSENRYPKKEDITKLAIYLKTTEEYLMTGATPAASPPTSTSTDYVEGVMQQDPVVADILASLIRRIKGEE